jgi:hypothetical protein
MRNRTYVIAALAGGLLLAGCASSGSSSPVVPTVNQASSGAAAGQGTDNQGAGSGRAAALHAAAECIRQHGIPSYSDPVLTSGGQVYSDSRSIGDAPDATINAVQHACGALAARAGLNPGTEPPAPPQLVEAGVRGAECMRAHGLPNVQDPTAQTPYIPGHGFSMTSSEIPAGGKASPVYQRAAHACRSLLDAEIRASTLASLGNDG